MNPDRERIRVVARMLIENRDRMTAHAASIRAVQRQRGFDFDLRAEYAEGSAAAYAIACSIVSGAFGESIDMLAGDDWQPDRGALPPILPDPDAIRGMPTDTVTVAAVARARAEQSPPLTETEQRAMHGDR